MQGTLINSGSIIIGSIIGLIIHKRLPVRITTRVFQGIGLFTLFLGIYMASKTNNILIMIFSIVLGAVIGEAIDIERYMDNFSEWIKKRVKSTNENFSNGFTTAFLLFCMGSMTILGSFEEGLGGKPNLLYTKSVLDGFSSIALAASLGYGVVFSVIPLLIYQGGLTLFASALHTVFTQNMINELTATSGLLLIGMGINILEIKKLNILNMIPSLVIAVILAYFLA